jgi:hypothetical protein
VCIALPVAALVTSDLLPYVAMRIEVLAYPDTFVVMDHGALLTSGEAIVTMHTAGVQFGASSFALIASFDLGWRWACLAFALLIATCPGPGSHSTTDNSDPNETPNCLVTTAWLNAMPPVNGVAEESSLMMASVRPPRRSRTRSPRGGDCTGNFLGPAQRRRDGIELAHVAL